MVQVNTPYPATPVLTGFLKEHGVEAHQADLSLEVALRLFTPETVDAALAHIPSGRVPRKLKPFASHSRDYRENVAPVVRFLQGAAPELAWRFAHPGSLPEGPHFRELTPDDESDPEETA